MAGLETESLPSKDQVKHLPILFLEIYFKNSQSIIGYWQLLSIWDYDCTKFQNVNATYSIVFIFTSFDGIHPVDN